MTKLQKQARIPQLNGIMFSDPSYANDVWCRYQKDITATNWNMQYLSVSVDKTEYNDDYIDFMIILTKPNMEHSIEVNEELNSFTFPKSLKTTKYNIGMDTASIYIGQTTTFNPQDWDNENTISTGTDGTFGTAYELNDNDETVAIIFIGYIDANFATKESLWKYLKETFKAQE